MVSSTDTSVVTSVDAVDVLSDTTGTQSVIDSDNSCDCDNCDNCEHDCEECECEHSSDDYSSDEEDEEEEEDEDDDENTNIIRGKWIYDGSKTIDDMIECLRREIGLLEDFKSEGWYVESEVQDDYAYLRRDVV